MVVLFCGALCIGYLFHVYVCVCMYLCVCMYVCVYACVCMYVCVYVCMYVCMYVHMYMCVCWWLIMWLELVQLHKVTIWQISTQFACQEDNACFCANLVCTRSHKTRPIFLYEKCLMNWRNFWATFCLCNV